MDNMWLYIGIFVIGILAIGVPIILSKIINKKKKEKEKRINPPDLTGNVPEDEGHPEIVVKEEDHALYDQFMAEYGDDNFKFENTQFRKGARITCEFGIANGYRMEDGKMEWGYVRLHTGVDRAGGGSQSFSWSDSPIRDIVKSPFDFNRSNFIHYGDRGYGTLVQLFNDKYGFEMRIAHMAPNDFVKWTLNRVKNKKSIGKNYVLGSAGTYGASSGEHTHTEFLSIDEACETFEILLEEKYGDKVHKEYTPSEVVKLYRKYKHFEDASEREILKDWEEVKKKRKSYFANKYMYRYVDWKGRNRTRYSSELLFNGL